MKENLATNMPIVAAKNRKKIGYVEATSYYPQIVIVAGASRRRNLLENGFVRSYAWVEAGAMEINADDEVGCNELLTKLGALICQRATGGNCNMPGTISPWLVETYPFEGYCIYSYNGDKYRQAFLLNPVTREVQLANSPVKVQEKFVNAMIESAPLVDNGAHYAPAQSRAMAQSTSRGAANSELMTQLVRNMADINVAVEMYLNAIKHGGYIQPRFCPVPLVNNKIATALAAQGINIFDFCKWWSGAAEKDTATVGTGESVHKSKFAYAPPGSDPSAWKLPIHDATHARNALARVNQADIPKSARAGVLNKVQKAAKKFGVSVSGKTPGQKKWAKVAASIDSLLDQLSV
jgi:hypothetical protein